jgi:hypothetical protein
LIRLIGVAIKIAGKNSNSNFPYTLYRGELGGNLFLMGGVDGVCKIRICILINSHADDTDLADYRGSISRILFGWFRLLETDVAFWNAISAVFAENTIRG